MLNAFLLTRQWRDTHDGVLLDFWWATEHGACWTQVTAQEIVFFIPRKDASTVANLFKQLRRWRIANVNLKTFRNEAVSALYFKNQHGARKAQDLLKKYAISYWEADIRPHERYLMERFITAAAVIEDKDSVESLSSGEVKKSLQKPLLNPRFLPGDYRPHLKIISLDIETSMDARQLFSIAVWAENTHKVFMVGAGESTTHLLFCGSQKDCLQEFLAWFLEYDADIIIGWSVVQFDLWVLETLCKEADLSLQLGRANQALHWRQDEHDGRRYVVIPGRIALDGIELLKAANFRFESYSLQFVSETILGSGKLLHGSGRGKDIARLFVEDKHALAEYNLRDCELVWDIFNQEKLLHFALERSQLTGLLLDRIGGSVAAFEYSYLPRLHRRGYIAPNLGEFESDVVSPGGYVMNSQPGIYDNILVLDFKSLYPSIIRTFLIDPCAFWLTQHQQLAPENIVPGFNGATFARSGHILPQMIEHLSAARDIAKQQHNSPLSHAIKIIMNSFYGVLGSIGCRFFDPRVCSSITLRGHEIIQRSRDWIEQQGYTVIYGDTDSLFVWVKDNSSPIPKPRSECQEIGRQLATELNRWWKTTLKKEYALTSYLEIQFETHYVRFLMPTIRGSELGTKKRYAGIIDINGQQELIFKGLENVRTDWTRLAKDFQEQLYNKVFAGEDYRDFLRETKNEVLAGKRDKELVYRKRLRRHLHEYEKNIPPHVQAARKYVQLTGNSLRRGDWIDYVITTNGPEAVVARQSPLNYQHYVEKQLIPVADGILYFMEQSMNELVDSQLSLFQSDTFTRE